MDTEGILRSLGRRIRERREAEGHSLAALAREAAVSRRYLTDTESGRANPSVLVLAQLARALGCTMADLLGQDGLRRTSERIALVGLRGAGKSTIGPKLALALEAPFIELDERIEQLAGLSLAEIFDLHGTSAYERFQAEALEEVLAQGGRAVIATGGSLVTDTPTYERLLSTCRTVWLRAPGDVHFNRVLAQGDGRPMRNHPRAMDELEALLDKRSPLYSRAEITVDTGARKPDEVVQAIEAALGT
jgi:XRE family transcriptional regulator, aerobic/anaerobic benzoate catabolism transcriptional regulator